MIFSKYLDGLIKNQKVTKKIKLAAIAPKNYPVKQIMLLQTQRAAMTAYLIAPAVLALF